MELHLKPYRGNPYPLKGLFIRGSSVRSCLEDIQALHLNIDTLRIFPVPGTTANSIGGLLFATHQPIEASVAGKHALYQLVDGLLFIPEQSIPFPPISAAELDKVCSSVMHIMHPDFGVAALTEELQLESLLQVPRAGANTVIRPQLGVFIPQQIKSAQIKPLSAEETLRHLEEHVFPKKQVMEHKPLNLLEKGKLALYQLLFRQQPHARPGQPVRAEQTDLGSKLDKLLRRIFPQHPQLTAHLQAEYEDLENRNQREIDKLMALFKSNPEEALKYAIPLDANGSSRGGANGQFRLHIRWIDLLLSATGGQSASSGSIDIGDHYFELQQQYSQSANAFLDKQEYQKAAFVYLKLLNNPYLAAQALEKGKYYLEAATIYLKHAHQKLLAAQCYERGNMTQEAIALYIELNEYEKAGDLYTAIHQPKEAAHYYEKVIDQYTSKHQYIPASLICINKMNRLAAGQELLLRGWVTNHDPVNCLQHYFSNIRDKAVLKQEIDTVYRQQVTARNSMKFLRVLTHEYHKQHELAGTLKDLAYEIVAAQLPENPHIVESLNGFAKGDSEFSRDIVRFKTGVTHKTKTP